MQATFHKEKPILISYILYNYCTLNLMMQVAKLTKIVSTFANEIQNASAINQSFGYFEKNYSLALKVKI